MFQAGLQERMQLLEPELVEVSDTCLHLAEKIKLDVETGEGVYSLLNEVRRLKK